MSERETTTLEMSEPRENEQTSRQLGNVSMRDGRLVFDEPMFVEPDQPVLTKERFDVEIDTSIEAVKGSIGRIFGAAQRYAIERADKLRGADADVMSGILEERDENSDLFIGVNLARDYKPYKVGYAINRGTVGKSRWGNATIDTFVLEQDGLKRGYGADIHYLNYEKQLIDIDKDGEVSWAEGVGPKRQRAAALGLMLIEQRLNET